MELDAAHTQENFAHVRFDDIHSTSGSDVNEMNLRFET